MSAERDRAIDKLWENSGHGTRREDVEAAYAAGLDARVRIAEHARANEGLSFDRILFERTANNRVRLHYIKDGIGVLVTHDYDLFVSDSVAVPATGQLKIEAICE